jgi:formiminotetrahydrofolate cyclodeaminase
MGVMLASRNLAQVTMNLTDFEVTPPHVVFEAVRREAEREGVAIAGSEIIGLIPRRAIEMAPEFFLRVENFQPAVVLENRVAEAVAGKGVLGEFLDALAAPAAPGGGSAAAAAAAMAAALGAMAARLAKSDASDFEADRMFFAAAVTRDAEAYSALVAAGERCAEALRQATAVPLEVAERVAALAARLAELAARAPAGLTSDLQTARALAAAALTGALANVETNLDHVTDADFRQSVEARLAALSSE